MLKSSAVLRQHLRMMVLHYTASKTLLGGSGVVGATVGECEGVVMLVKIAHTSFTDVLDYICKSYKHTVAT